MEKQAQPPADAAALTPAPETSSAAILAEAIEHVVAEAVGQALGMAASGSTAAPPAPPRNKGWFQQGDRRINREGRPRGSKGPASADGPEVRAVRTDRVMWFGYQTKHLREHLLPSGCERVAVNGLPTDCEIVGCHVYPTGFMAIVIRSKAFPRVARGALIPRFPGPAASAAPQLRRKVRRVIVPEKLLDVVFQFPEGKKALGLPSDWSCSEVAVANGGYAMLISSDEFAPVAPGEPVPVVHLKATA